MFTGLIEEIGTIREILPGGESGRITVEAPKMAGELTVGESVAVDGVCLTVEVPTELGFTAFVTDETLSRTSLSGARPGRRVNLERAMRLGDRLGGHLVAGHVDAVGEMTGLEPRGEGWLLRVAAPADILRVSVPKGSVAVDGISLTLVDLTASEFTVAVIPETYRGTTLHLKQIGGPVNLESDMIGKMVYKHLGVYNERSTASRGAATPLELLMDR